MTKGKTICLILSLLPVGIGVAAQETTDSVDKEAAVSEVTVTSQVSLRRLAGAANGVSIGRKELFKAACCNLGESFTTNPSVDVSYSDAATGAKQIRLLGLSGTYVQMLTEQLPAFRGAALPYALDYVPGQWMQSIEVSKGASTVKNGYESITGQIDIEYLKPNDTEHIDANLYADTKERLEATAAANIHLTPQLSTIVLAHADKALQQHDSNDDGFADMPSRQQFNLQNRWKLVADRYIMHAGLSALKEKREGGQTAHLHSHVPYVAIPSQPSHPHLYTINTETDRYEAYMKHAFILDPERQGNIALMASATLHLQDATYGHTAYDNNEKTLHAQLMYETDITPQHQISIGTALDHYHNRQHLDGQRSVEQETTTGLYAQYTLNLGNRFTAMAGLRADYSDQWHCFVTPRLHLKYTPAEIVTLRASVGKGYRTPHFMAENHYLLASGRTLVNNEPLRQEQAWNAGLNTAWTIPVGGRTLRLNAEYYYTRFGQQTVVDRYDEVADAQVSHLLAVYNLDGKSYSHTLQLDATYPLLPGMSLTAAWRWNDAKCTYRGQLMQRPLTSRYKALLSATYAPGLVLWHFDATLQLCGGGRIIGDERFHAYEQLQAQVTRDFRRFSVYIGGENLTNRRQHNPIRGYDDPWGDAFDATLVWGPVHGPIVYAGIRMNIER